jgi:hypothetical protein
MSTFRAILIALIATSVAMLPVAGGMARAAATGISLSAMPADCCPHAKPCEKKSSDDCASMAGCALKCFNFFGTMAPSAVVRLTPAADLAPMLVNLRFDSNPTAPPPPPPRV